MACSIDVSRAQGCNTLDMAAMDQLCMRSLEPMPVSGKSHCQSNQDLQDDIVPQTISSNSSDQMMSRLSALPELNQLI